jgi:hypothetical protein
MFFDFVDRLLIPLRAIEEQEHSTGRTREEGEKRGGPVLASRISSARESIALL